MRPRQENLELTSDSIVKRLLRKMTSLVWRVENLIVENGEVQCKTETDGMSRSEVGGSNLSGSFVSLQRFVGGNLTLVAKGKFGKVAMVVTLPVRARLAFRICCVADGKLCAHLVIEDLRFAALGGFDQMLIKDLQDIFADLGKLGLNLLTVFLDQSDLGFVAFRFLLLFDRGDDPPGGTSRPDNVLVGD